MRGEGNKHMRNRHRIKGEERRKNREQGRK